MIMDAQPEKTRICGFCFRSFAYDELPEGSVCYVGICACGECLESGSAEDFRALIEAVAPELETAL